MNNQSWMAKANSIKAVHSALVRMGYLIQNALVPILQL